MIFIVIPEVVLNFYPKFLFSSLSSHYDQQHYCQVPGVTSVIMNQKKWDGLKDQK